MCTNATQGKASLINDQGSFSNEELAPFKSKDTATFTLST
jgi:hypothetical protein